MSLARFVGCVITCVAVLTLIVTFVLIPVSVCGALISLQLAKIVSNAVAAGAAEVCQQFILGQSLNTSPFIALLLRGTL